MSRRVSLPGAAELFRGSPEPEAPATPSPRPGGSGRVRHDEKITVYISSDELLALEQARLALRSEHGLAVDRGRIVREAISLALESLSAEGAESLLVQRLREK